MAKGVGPREGCFNVLCTGAEGAGTGNSKSRGRSAGEAETEDAGGKVFMLLVSCIFHFLNI